MDNDNLPDDYRSRTYPVKEEMRFQRFAWKAQRAGFLLLFLFILAACLGLFSQGVLSNASTRSPDGNMVLEYDRFGRNSTDTNFILRVRVAKENALTVNFGGDIMDNYAIEFIQPLPTSSFISNRTLTLMQPVTQKDSWYSIYITLKPNKMGHFNNTVSLSEKEKISFSQWVYP